MCSCRYHPDKKTGASDWRCRHLKQFNELKDFYKGVLNMGEFNIKKLINYDSFNEDF